MTDTTPKVITEAISEQIPPEADNRNKLILYKIPAKRDDMIKKISEYIPPKQINKNKVRT